MNIKLDYAPSENDWMWVKYCALGTMGREPTTEPSSEWKKRILRARHSPIRELIYKFTLTDIPYWVSVHLVRHHIGCQWYVQSQRNDRQDKYDRNSARQDSPVTVRVSINAEELMTIANKRLCRQASEETRGVVKEMCKLAEAHTPELHGLLVPNCVRMRGCEEMTPCGWWHR